MFRALLCPSSGAREYYTSGFCLSYLVLGFQVVGAVWSSAIKIHLLHLVGILFPHIIDDAGQNHIKSVPQIASQSSSSRLQTLSLEENRERK
jgi:hypothetical protein